MASPKFRATPVRIATFRVLAGFLLLFAALGSVAAAIGLYFAIAEFGRSGWPGIAIVSFVLGNTVLLFAVALRGVRIRNAEQLEAQSKSPVIESLRQRLRL